ncbi:MAG: GIY-YIG nuclease family protein [Methanoregulaceae archaeon]|jgi:Uri superfamily endonuclease|nr:GIY-YIG nuclease family protein [Methanoregulaceae archaeon]
MDKGIYCLTFRSTPGDIRVGALGVITFREGWLVYVGSAQGSGGLLRVRRHILFSGSRKKPRWHIDYLLISPTIQLVNATCLITTNHLECVLATLLGSLPEAAAVPRFGSSDCRCPSHLIFFPNNPTTGVLSCFHSLGPPAPSQESIPTTHSVRL